MKLIFRPTLLDTAFLRREFAPRLRNCFAAFLILCALFTVLCLLFPKAMNVYIDMLMQYMDSAGVLEESGSAKTFFLILQNNVEATILTVMYGFLPFLFYPAASLGSNALSLAAIGVYSVQGGFTLRAFLAGILPHGIFEIPALLVAIAIGLCHCRLTTDLILRREIATPWRAQIVTLSYVYLCLVLPLLLLAAAIETFLTPLVMNLFL